MLTINEKEFEKLSSYISRHYGIYLSKQKMTLINGRLGNTLFKQGFKSFMQYYEYVVSDQTGKAAGELLNSITTNHTFFMREVAHFNFFKKHALPELTSTLQDKDIRVWSAGCSSGEEPYTLAMIMDEYFDREKQKWNTDVLATDISTKALKKASDGIYTEEQIAVLPHNWKKQYFKLCEKNKYIIKDKVKNSIILRRFNLAQNDFTFKRKFHVIFCRNVMIYFDQMAKKQLVENFYHCMAPGGYLFVGHSETLSMEKTKFRYVQPAVYRKE